MTDFLDLALKYGGFTSLDRAYLENKLLPLTIEQRRAFITPPPSVINAYFAEIYQKEGPKAATDYYFQLSLALELFGPVSFVNETIPFVRLNLSGKAYGFAYDSQEEQATVFQEVVEEPDCRLLLDIAQLFPHYSVWLEQNSIKLAPVKFDESGLSRHEQLDFPLSEVFISDKLVKIQGFNQDEVLQAAERYQGQRYYGFSQRQAIIYITK